MLPHIQLIPSRHTYRQIHLPRVRLWSVPEGQLLHDPAPDTALYVPAVHAVHVPPFGPVKPALQAQSEEASLPAGEDDPAMMPSRQLVVHVAGYFQHAISICILQYSEYT